MSQHTSLHRRQLLSTAALVGGSLSLPGSHLSHAQQESRSALERLGVGAIGLRYQGSVIAHKAAMFGDIVAVCDVDKNVRDPVKAAFGSTPKDYEDYRELLADPAVDIVTVGAPDHWHAKMVIDACRAGKDVYCEKPLTLTIDEGRVLREAVKETGRIVQVGSWQRSDHRFRQAAEMVRQGRIGELRSVEVVLGKNEVGGAFEPRKVPLNFNWDLWLGQAPSVPFLAERSHYTFRWWYEYAGGQMTDWGAHHLDIAQWAINSLPIEVEGEAVWPKQAGGFNVPVDFKVHYKFANNVTLSVSDTGRNGILFTGEKGRIFVNRGTLEGKPVEELKQTPLTREQWQLYEFDNLDRPERAGKLDAIINHMGNFFDCVQTRNSPVSDIESQHRSASTCHLGNICLRLGRKVTWNPVDERFENDSEANQYLSRPQRAGYEVA